jgi:hypothetical protein
MIRIASVSLSLVLLAACGAAPTNVAQNSAASGSAAAPAAAGNAAAPAAAATAGLDGARRLIDEIYTPYTTGAMADPTDRFAPELAAAIQHAAEGALEADPFCDCQDFDRFTYRIESLEPNAGGAVARVAISNSGEAKTIAVRLVNRAGTWLVADVGEGENSLTRTLARP